MMNALALSRTKYFAVAEVGGLFTVFHVMQDDPTALQPLEQFGFVVQPWRSARDTPHAAPTVVSVPPDSADTSEPSSLVRFRSQSGNITCEIITAGAQVTAVCEVAEHTYKPEVRSNCLQGWINSFALSRGQPVAVDCYPVTAFEHGAVVSAYGFPFGRGAMSWGLAPA